MRSMRWLLMLLAISITTVRAQTPPPFTDPYARIIARADAVVLGRVLEAGVREVPDDAQGDTYRGVARIAVERWLVGPDTNRTIEVRLSPYDTFLKALGHSAQDSDRRVLLYLVRADGRWSLVREVTQLAARPSVGIEILSTSEALARIPAISRVAEAASPDSLAAHADLVVVGMLGRLRHDPPARPCRVERIISGAFADTVLDVTTENPHDLRRGRALLLLVAGPGGSWQVLNNGAGCYYLDLDRVAHSDAHPETVFARIAASHARRIGRDGR